MSVKSTQMTPPSFWNLAPTINAGINSLTWCLSAAWTCLRRLPGVAACSVLEFHGHHTHTMLLRTAIAAGSVWHSSHISCQCLINLSHAPSPLQLTPVIQFAVHVTSRDFSLKKNFRNGKKSLRSTSSHPDSGWLVKLEFEWLHHKCKSGGRPYSNCREKLANVSVNGWTSYIFSPPWMETEKMRGGGAFCRSPNNFLPSPQVTDNDSRNSLTSSAELAALSVHRGTMELVRSPPLDFSLYDSVVWGSVARALALTNCDVYLTHTHTYTRTRTHARSRSERVSLIRYQSNHLPYFGEASFLSLIFHAGFIIHSLPTHRINHMCHFPSTPVIYVALCARHRRIVDDQRLPKVQNCALDYFTATQNVSPLFPPLYIFVW